MEVKTGVIENCQKKKKWRKRHKFLITELFRDFSKNTTLHGLRYVTQKNLSTVEKIFWFTMFVISVALCFMLIERVWYKWRSSPVIVSFNERMIPVGEVPFPAVTICPQMKNKLREHEYAKQYKKYSRYAWTGRSTFPIIKEEVKMLDDAMLVCRNENDVPDHILRNNTTDVSTIDNIVKISPTIKDTLLRQIEWRGHYISSEKLFNNVITSEGICYTFNTIKHTDMLKNESVQNKFLYLHPTPDKVEHDDDVDYKYPTVYPRLGQESGAYPDLSVILHQNASDKDGLCNSLYNGYKIYLHHPDDMPQSSLFYYPVLLGEVTSLAIKFSAVSTSESLMKYAPDVRQCYTSKDRELRYFKKYSLSNCRLECFSIYTYKKCGCVWFHMPHSNSSEICTPKKRKCVEMAKHELASNKSIVNTEDDCKCLPSCDSIKYDADVFRATYDFYKYSLAFFGPGRYRNGTTKKDKYNISYSKLEVYFKETQFTSIRRSELFGLTEFLANCGGLLGLFLGFSFLSIVEVFYFCTLRLWYALKAEKNDCDKVNNTRNKMKKSKKIKDGPVKTSEKSQMIDKEKY